MTPKSTPAMTASSSEHRMECMELWGGSSETDTAVTMSGLSARVFSQPYGEGAHGGDVYYFSSCASGRIARILLADVTGHGITVADTASQLRNAMRRNVNVIRQTKLMDAINHEFGQLSECGGFATAVLITYFSPTRSLTVSLAGHPPPLLFRGATQEWTPLTHVTDNSSKQLQDLPLGIAESVHYSSIPLTFEPDDQLLIYTDAFSEACDAHGEILQVPGLLKLVNDAPSDARSDIVSWLIDQMHVASRENLRQDDATLIALHRPAAGFPSRTICSRRFGSSGVLPTRIPFRVNEELPHRSRTRSEEVFPHGAVRPCLIISLSHLASDTDDQVGISWYHFRRRCRPTGSTGASTCFCTKRAGLPSWVASLPVTRGWDRLWPSHCWPPTSCSQPSPGPNSGSLWPA